ncbi:hypothetical protein DEG02_019635 [Xanthomonas vasicola]|nr:hypothetical protein KWO_006050 [Xanthomonas vasicola pv. musacearum NCPPB 4379]AZR34112.1 hypothetical protein NX08_006080 [Xanthomonas vasicola]KFA05754.1 hypothetical protein KWM_0118385 [Xanthomonas vasicola pv. musacearum NCPPB 2005]KFA11070.1 hypothetical protein KWQ_0109715 [Xanthomonas vasicola pv. musacearum NCPPB 4380]KFA21729.1 hypothetical protein A11G_0101100 [Xanthomonas vasicola pv. musacearum NCPPB 4392]KFA25071.1 hypothetical protein KWU_0103885 [Xanthomonas vasicola pv. mu
MIFEPFNGLLQFVATSDRLAITHEYPLSAVLQLVLQYPGFCILDAVFTFERPESVDKIVDSWQQLLTHSFTQPALYEAKCIVWLDAQARSFWPGSERGETRVFMCSRALVVTARSFRIVVSRRRSGRC